MISPIRAVAHFPPPTPSCYETLKKSSTSPTSPSSCEGSAAPGMKKAPPGTPDIAPSRWVEPISLIEALSMGRLVLGRHISDFGSLTDMLHNVREKILESNGTGGYEIPFFDDLLEELCPDVSTSTSIVTSAIGILNGYIEKCLEIGNHITRLVNVFVQKTPGFVLSRHIRQWHPQPSLETVFNNVFPISCLDESHSSKDCMHLVVEGMREISHATRRMFIELQRIMGKIIKFMDIHVTEWLKNATEVKKMREKLSNFVHAARLVEVSLHKACM